jgi:hypothetical protein
MALCALAPPAGAAQSDSANFDHIATGFPLDGQHLNLKCEQCHLHGVFSGLSKQCSTCHIQGNPLSAVYVPATHIPLESAAFRAADCNTCHTSSTFQGAHFAHASVMPGTCQTCHNNVNATGKTAHHLITDLSCDKCHTTVSFATSFATYPIGHLPTTQACTTCHDAAQFVPGTMNHAGISSGCVTCHAADAPGTAALVFTIKNTPSNSATWVTLKPTSQNYHPPTSAPPTHFTTAIDCSQCHTAPAGRMPATAAAGGFLGAVMNHKGITSGCASCHADGVGPFAGVTSLVTESRKGAHIPISGTACELCHKSTTVPGGFAGTAMVHTGLNGLSTCNNCHENNAADLAFYGLSATLVVRPPTSGAQPNAATQVDSAHPSTGDCSQCHSSTTSFNTGIAAPSNHIPIGSTACANCHLGTKAPYLAANTAMNHAGFTTTCSGCHGAGKNFLGSGQTEAGGQPMQPPGSIGAPGAVNHIPYGTADCVGCHSATSTAQGGFKITATPALSPAGHNVVSALACSTCHYASGTAGDVSWLGTTAKGMPGAVGTPGAANHIAVGSGDCKACHDPSSTAQGGFVIAAKPQLTSGHSLVSALACAACHAAANSAWYGVTATAPATNHIPMASADCISCHAASQSNFVVGGFKVSTKPVLSVTGHNAVQSLACISCHENNAGDLGFQGVLTQIYLRPGNAVAGLSTVDVAHATGTLATGDCKQCHTTSPPFQGGPSDLPTNHIPLPASGAGATCTTCHAAGYTPATSTMNHASVTTESCTSCHGAGKGPFAGTGPGAGGQPVQPPGTVGTSGAGNHMPLGTADCGTACHASTDTESGTGFKLTTTPLLSANGHAAVNTVACATCHSTSTAWFGVPSLVTQLANHIPIANAACSASGCHASNFVTGGFHIASAPSLSVAGHAAVSSLTCASCHNNNATDLGFQGVAAQIYVRPGTATAGLSPVDVDHATGLLLTSDCVQCHSTTPPFQGSTNGLPGNHIPLPASGAGAMCATCHAAGYTPALSKIVHSAVTTVAGGCTACHGAGKGPFSGSGPGAGGQPVQPPGTVGTSGAGNHIPVSTADCSAACHAVSDTENGTGFKLTTTPLLSVTGHTAVNALSCATCHSSGMAWFGTTTVVPPGTVGTSGAANHIAVGTGDCSTCHGTTIAVGAFKIGSTPSLATAGHQAVSSASCASCHATGAAWFGVPSLVTQLASHIPIGTATCNASGCHASNFVTGGFHISGTPGTSPVLSVTGHAAVSSLTCASCHNNNAADLAFQGVAGQIYLRPGNAVAGLSLIDGAHATGQLATNDCSQCHTTTPPFVGNNLPNNHIPLPASGAGATCSTCHAAGYTPALSKIVHSAVTTVAGGCTACHGAGKGPFVGSGPGAGGQPVQPPGTVGTSGAGNHIPVSTADCGAACHAVSDTENGTGFKLTTTPLLSGTGHTAVNALTCATCHSSGMAWFGTTTVVPPGTVGTAGAANHIAVGTGDCSTCHGTTIAVGAFKIGSTPSLAAAGHQAVSSASCASCHATGAAWFGVPSLVTQLASHIPIGTATCNASGCHASNFVTGGFHISGTPGTSPVLSVTGHAAVSSLTCVGCHENNGTDLAFQGVAGQIYLRPGTTAAGLSPIDAAHATGTLAAPNDCAACHTSTPPFTGSTLPGNHFPLPTPAPACAVCHAAGYGVGKSIMVHSSVTTLAGGCTACHGVGKGPFAGTSQGAGGQPKQPPGTVGTSGAGNHIPVSTADCGAACHAAVDAMTGTGFKLTTTPLLSGTGHTAVNALKCGACHNSGMAWFGVTIVVPPGTVGTSGTANHIALGTGDCSTCHGTTIAVGAFKVASTPSLATAGHQAVSAASCASCHATGAAWYGVPSLVTQLASHLPIGTATCNASGCHASNFVTGGFHISGTPGTSPVLSVTGHAAVSSLSCVGCHENNATDLGFQGVAGQIYLRPGTTVAGLSPIDAAHATGTLAAPNDCAACHTTTPPFTGSTLPSNHFPLPTPAPACAVCHANGYGVGKSIMVHSSVTKVAGGCTACHGAGKGPFAGTSQGAGGQPKQPPGTVGTSGTANHIPVGSADCGAACHAAVDAMTGTGFKLTMLGNSSAHGAVASLACTTCHGSGMAWYGVTIKVPPGAVGTPGAANHIAIPVVSGAADACTVCHSSASTYTTFAGGAMNHAGITGAAPNTCTSCHARGDAWYGVSNLVTALSNHIAVNSGVDCVTCHGQNFGTGGFKISSSPVLTTANHSYVSTTCDNCHNNNSTDLAFQGVGTAIYVRPGTAAAGLSPVDANHATGNLATQDCSACHTTTPPFTGNTEPSNHIPTGTGSNCAANCHKGGFTAAGTVMDHADPSVSGTACVTCHGKGKGPFYGTAQSQAGGQPMQPPGTVGVSGAANHIPMGTGSLTCNTGCHTAAPPTAAVSGGFSFAMRGNTAAHNVVVNGANCDTCHESGLSFYLDATGGSSIRTRPNGHHVGQDCGSPNGCHAGQYSGFAAAAAAAAAKATRARPTSGLTKRIPSPTGPDGRPVKLAGSGPYSHLGIAPGTCIDCHSAGGGASAMPGAHLPTTLSCDVCHRTTVWTPVAYAHAGVGPGRCATCHAGPGTWATPKPAGHFVTGRSCDKCHRSTANWLPVVYDHLSPRYRPQPGILSCIGCHTTNIEVVLPGPKAAAGRKAVPGGPARTP